MAARNGRFAAPIPRGGETKHGPAAIGHAPVWRPPVHDGRPSRRPGADLGTEGSSLSDGRRLERLRGLVAREVARDSHSRSRIPCCAAPLALAAPSRLTTADRAADRPAFSPRHLAAGTGRGSDSGPSESRLSESQLSESRLACADASPPRRLSPVCRRTARGRSQLERGRNGLTRNRVRMAARGIRDVPNHVSRSRTGHGTPFKSRSQPPAAA